MLWNWFRLLPNSRAYYEPTNPILKQLIKFDPKPNPEHRHHHVDSWVTEYQELTDFNDLFRPYFSDLDLYLSAESKSNELEKYLKYLFNAPYDLVVVKDLNMHFRGDWLKKIFPEIEIVYLKRSPRVIWTSSLRIIEKTYSDFKQRYNYGNEQLTAYQNDLESTFPFLAGNFCPHPYYRFYFICRLADFFNKTHARVFLDYDQLIKDPESTLSSMFDKLEIKTDVKALLAKAPVIPSPTTIPKELSSGLSFEKVEEECEEILKSFSFDENFSSTNFEKIYKENQMYKIHEVNLIKGRTRQLKNIYEESCERWLITHEKEKEIQTLKSACDERLEMIKKLSQ